ncbi:MAG: hypothetical protein Q8L48_32525 [Archangium sp.]|nr:hypothetical protein [Archangium sp.]
MPASTPPAPEIAKLRAPLRIESIAPEEPRCDRAAPLDADGRLRAECKEGLSNHSETNLPPGTSEAEKLRAQPAEDVYEARGAGAFFFVEGSFEFAGGAGTGAILGLDVVLHRWAGALIGFNLGIGYRYTASGVLRARSIALSTVPASLVVDVGVRLGSSASEVVFRAGALGAYLGGVGVGEFVGKALLGLKFQFRSDRERGYWSVGADFLVVNGLVFIVNLGRAF